MTAQTPPDKQWKEQLQSMMKELQVDVDQMQNLRDKEVRSLDEDMQLIHLLRHVQDRFIKLNVGGRRFQTTALTLSQSDPTSLLGSIFSGTYDVQYNDKGEIYIDREGKYFHYILEYLRDGFVLLPEDKNIMLKVAKEAEFYGLEGLLKILRIQHRINPPQAIDLSDLKGALNFYVWGSGGGNSNRGGRGGAGGYSWGYLNLADVATFDFKVVVGDFTSLGGGGISPTPSSSSYNTVKAGNGGGYSGIFVGDESPLLIAGGGGGGGNGGSYHGGAGGGLNGQTGSGPSSNRTGKGASQFQSVCDGENSYGGSIKGTGCGQYKGGDGSYGSYDAGAGGGGGYFGGGGGGEGGGVDGPPGGGGSGYVSDVLQDAGTSAGNFEQASLEATEEGYSNTCETVGRIKVVWTSDKGIHEHVFSKPGEYVLNPLTFQQ
jgi:hypothetical protein